MLRSRIIKPSIMTNENLCSLGPYAYILYTGLWMIADREGRFEDRPLRIKALCMPLWDEVCGKAVDNLLEKLCKSGFISRYSVQGVKYVEILNWRKHQNPHPREAYSCIPMPSVRDFLKMDVSAAVAADSNGQSKALPRQCQGHVEPVLHSSSNSKRAADVKATSMGAAEEKTPPPPKKRRKPTQRERSAEAPVEPAEEPLERKPPARAAPNSWPHSDEAVALIRESLAELARELHRPPPDDDIIRRVLDAGNGVSADAIHWLLVSLHRKRKFDDMRSWGLLPVVIAGQCHNGAA
jgi:hypothetical protein